MRRKKSNNPGATGSFRVPNSLVQGLTTDTPSNLNHLTWFEMIVLFGLLAYVSSKSPSDEVFITPQKLLDIVEIGHNVAQAIDCSWTLKNGQTRQKRYPAMRFSPRHVEMVHEALLQLHSQSVCIPYRDSITGRLTKVVTVHILDSFGYIFGSPDQRLDLDDLPSDCGLFNVGSEERPVLRVRRRTAEGEEINLQIAEIFFRLNSELAREILGERNTIQFTLFARKIFELFRGLRRSPAVIRLAVLTLRQTGVTYNRTLSTLLEELGFDTTHPRNARIALQTAFESLQLAGVVAAFTIDPINDRVEVVVNRNWHRDAEV